MQKDDPIGVMADALGRRTRPVKAPITGIVIGYTRHPLVSQGEALVHLADIGALIDDEDSLISRPS